VIGGPSPAHRIAGESALWHGRRASLHAALHFTPLSRNENLAKRNGALKRLQKIIGEESSGNLAAYGSEMTASTMAPSA